MPISAIHDTKITNVCLYSGFAEVTRIFKANLKVGDNNVVVSNLPVVLLPESLRCEVFEQLESSYLPNFLQS